MSEGGPGRRCAVLGQPIEHSLSPALHRAAYDDLGLDWTYDAVEVGPGELSPFLAGLDASWRGLSLTMPLKREVLPLLDALDEWALLSGAANTVVLGEDERTGFNTDIPGAMAALRERGADSFSSAVVLGGGATAASVLLALAELGLGSARLLVRDPARAAETVEALRHHRRAPTVEVGTLDEPGVLDAVDIVVSTVPAEAQTPALVAACAQVPVVFDVIYHPWPTPLASSVVAAGDSRGSGESEGSGFSGGLGISGGSGGRVLVSGLDLLVHQAALQVELMTGVPGPLAVMRTAGEAALADR